MKKITFFLAFLLGIFVVLNGQTPKSIKIINSGDLIKKGIELFEKEKYQDALEIFKLIPENDTNYALSLYEQCYTLSTDKKYDEAISLANYILKYDHLYKDKAQVYTLLGNTLDNAKRSSEAIEVYNRAIKEFPYNYMIFYNLGLSYFKSDQVDKAEEALFKAIKLNVFHQTSHYLLGYVNIKRGKLVPAIMALNMGVLINPESKIGANSLEALENLYNGELDDEMQKDKFSFPEAFDNSCFDEIEPLIKSNFAMNSKYKVDSKISNIIIKQNHLIFEKLKRVDSPKGIYNEFYVPFYCSIMEDDYYEGFSYYLFSGLDNEKAKAFLEKNKAKIKKFQDWGATYIFEKRMYQLNPENEKKQEIKYYYNSDYRVYAYGKTINLKNPEKTGEWIYINKSGGLETFGIYEKDQKQGNWKSYHLNGNLNENLQYKNSDLEGYSTKNYPNGEINIKANFKKGKLEGEYLKHNNSGVISEKANYKNGLKEGVFSEYYSQGRLFSETEYKAGKKDGNYKRYFIDGKTDMEVPYKNDMANGKYIEYFVNGNIYSEGNYKDNNKTGYWKEYYFNKQLKEEGAYDDKGRKIGPWKSYYSNGILEQEDNYSLNGKQNGESKYYTKNGELLYTYTFKNELLTEITCFNKEKKEIAKYGERKGVIDFKLFSIDGKVTLEGKLKNGLKEGLWKKYDVNGVLIFEENYKNGLAEGVIKTFYKNGNVSTYCEYEEGEKNGLYQSFYKDGTIKQEGYYLTGDAEGYWYSYHDNGNISDIDNYLNDKQDGYQETFDYLGKKSMKSFYKDDNLVFDSYLDTNGVVYCQDSLINGNGLVNRLNYNGTLALKALFLSGGWKDTVVSYNCKGIKTYEGFSINGKKDGWHKWYNDNGILKTEIFYKYGEKEGVSRAYDSKGKLNNETKYQNGRIENTTYYYPNGKPEISISYEDGERDGYTKYYLADGQFAFQIMFVNTIPVSYSYKGKDGKITDEKPISKENGVLTAYFQNGNKAAEINYNNGERNGKMVLYYSNGVKREENYFKDDQWDGNCKEWNQLGVLTSETQFSKGNNSGYKKVYYDNSKLEFEEHYLNDELHGQCNYYDKNGKKIKVLNYLFGDLLNEIKL